jgi:hypothetical protein
MLFPAVVAPHIKLPDVWEPSKATVEYVSGSPDHAWGTVFRGERELLRHC